MTDLRSTEDRGLGGADIDALLGSAPQTGPDLSHAEVLRLAAAQVEEYGLDDILIVDADYHHTEPNVWPEVLEYVENDVLQHFLGAENRFHVPGELELGGQENSGRIRPQTAWDQSHEALAGMTGAERDLYMARETMRLMGSDYISVFPTYLLDMGTSPYPELEAPLFRAWSRWAVERILSEEPGVISMLPLPFGDPEACLQMVEEFSDAPGVIGFMVTSVRYERNYAKGYLKLYDALQERGKTLGFHSGITLRDRITQFNKFISVHTVGFPLYHLVQATNLVVNGIPELFPKLDFLFIEGGLSWVPFLMQRLDHEYVMRPSEAPLLKQLPSEYLKRFYYTTQPLEAAHMGLLEETFRMLDAKTQLLYASDWPHWDWDPPSKILKLPFLDQEEKLNILGENARRLFSLA
jgi:uncharacterized protein